MNKQTPILIFSDAVTAPSGLARITRDLATRIATYLPDVFRVATVGYGGCGSSKLPFTQYSWIQNDQWIIHDLPELWQDFAGEQPGIFLSIYDLHRMLWLTRPETCSDGNVASFLSRNPFKKWGYLPIDATGPNNKLSYLLRESLLGYDRVLCYSRWAMEIVANTLSVEEAAVRRLDQLPHGIDTSVFYPRPRARQRQLFGKMIADQDIAIRDDELLVGIVATNQARKDFGLGISTVAELAKSRKVRLWIHTDKVDRHWSIPFLLQDFGITGVFLSVGHFTDDTMAKLYSACDVTLGIGLGEGFGYCGAESLACGTPVVAPNYGGAEYIPSEFLIHPIAFRVEGVHACVRPVMSVSDFSFAVGQVAEARRLMTGTLLPSGNDWNNLWPRWEAWFRGGIA